MMIIYEPVADPFDCQFLFITKIHLPEFAEQDRLFEPLTMELLNELPSDLNLSLSHVK